MAFVRALSQPLPSREADPMLRELAPFGKRLAGFVAWVERQRGPCTGGWWARASLDQLMAIPRKSPPASSVPLWMFCAPSGRTGKGLGSVVNDPGSRMR
jgi:hypothetical protein